MAMDVNRINQLSEKQKKLVRTGFYRTHGKHLDNETATNLTGYEINTYINQGKKPKRGGDTTETAITLIFVGLFIIIVVFAFADEITSWVSPSRTNTTTTITSDEPNPPTPPPKTEPNDVISLVNKYRRENGRNRLQISPKLKRAAQQFKKPDADYLNNVNYARYIKAQQYRYTSVSFVWSSVFVPYSNPDVVPQQATRSKRDNMPSNHLSQLKSNQSLNQAILKNDLEDIGVAIVRDSRSSKQQNGWRTEYSIVLLGKKQPSRNCDRNYSGGCVPVVSYDLDCRDIGFGVRVVGSDVHGFDGDNDGYGCETY